MLKDKLTLKQRQMIYGFIFISPWLIGFVWFFLLNIGTAFVYSLNRLVIDPVGGYELVSVGFGNYKHALTVHADFNRILVESLSTMLLDVPLIIFFSLFMAIILNHNFRGRTVVRAIFFLPVILLSPAIANALTSAMTLITNGISAVPTDMQETGGFSARYLMRTFMDLGFPPTMLEYVEDAVNRVYEIVRQSGVQILIFLAALQAIPGSLYEVAKIEGATSYETFWKVTLPMVSPLILTNVIYTIVDYFVISDVVEIAYNTAFVNMNFGLSSAMSMLSTLSVSVILLVIGTLISRKIFYYN